MPKVMFLETSRCFEDLWTEHAAEILSPIVSVAVFFYDPRQLLLTQVTVETKSTDLANERVVFTDLMFLEIVSLECEFSFERLVWFAELAQFFGTHRRISQ